MVVLGNEKGGSGKSTTARLAALGSRNKRLVGEGLTGLSKRMSFRCVEGFAERVVYR